MLWRPSPPEPNSPHQLGLDAFQESDGAATADPATPPAPAAALAPESSRNLPASPWNSAASTVQPVDRADDAAAVAPETRPHAGDVGVGGRTTWNGVPVTSVAEGDTLEGDGRVPGRYRGGASAGGGHDFGGLQRVTVMHNGRERQLSVSGSSSSRSSRSSRTGWSESDDGWAAGPNAQLLAAMEDMQDAVSAVDPVAIQQSMSLGPQTIRQG